MWSSAASGIIQFRVSYQKNPKKKTIVLSWERPFDLGYWILWSKKKKTKTAITRVHYFSTVLIFWVLPNNIPNIVYYHTYHTIRFEADNITLAQWKMTRCMHERYDLILVSYTVDGAMIGVRHKKQLWQANVKFLQEKHATYYIANVTGDGSFPVRDARRWCLYPSVPKANLGGVQQ